MKIDAEALFREHHVALYRYLLRMTGDEAMAKDAVQQAFLRLLERPPRQGNTRAWLFTVATNAVRDWTDHERRRDTLLMDRQDRVPVPTPEPSPERILERKQAARLVGEALAGLPRRDRAVLLLRAEGLRHREIAEAVGATTGSVGTMIARALERMSELLDSAQKDSA